MRTRTFVISCFCISIASAPLRSQTSEKKPQFEVASIKPVQDIASRRFSGGNCHGADTHIPPGALAPPPLGRCIFSMVPLQTLIATAYSNAHVAGGPSWVTSDMWDVEAKAEEPTRATEAQLNQMLQSLLEDRFKLKLHQEAKEVSTFTLVVAKGGPHLEKSTVESGGIVFGRGKIVAQHVTMKEFARSMGGMLGGDTSDNTGLTGVYDLTLVRPDDAVDSAWILTAVQDFGLKFVSRKTPIGFNVVDHAEKPPPN